MPEIRFRHFLFLAPLVTGACALDGANDDARVDSVDGAETEEVAESVDALTAGPVVKRFVAEADITVRTNSSTADSDLSWNQVGKTSRADHRTYFRFKVEGLTSAVRTATLRIYVDRTYYTKTMTANAYAVSNSWNEFSLLWSTAPALGTRLATKTFTTPPLDGNLSNSANLVAVDLDVSALVRGSGTFSVAVNGTSSSNDTVTFPSRKGNVYGESYSTSDQRPHLIVTTDGTAITATRPLVKTWPTLSVSGSTYTAVRGTWAGTTPAFRYQWQRCSLSSINKLRQDPAHGSCVNITAATGATYTKTTDDANRSLRVMVTATNAAGTDTAFSEAR